MKQRRIGMLGGTFDPVHQGHIEVASSVRAQLALDRVVFVPAYQPPHKKERPQANAWHRLAMLTLATQSRDDLWVSTIELETGQPAYSVDTVRRLQAMWGEAAQMYFIIGADSFEDIATWKEHERLLTSCHFAVMTRPGYSLIAEHLPAEARQRIVDLQRSQEGIRVMGQYHIYLCGGLSNPMSSTAIREALKTGHIPAGALAPAVEAYIRKYDLYRNDESEGHPGGVAGGEDHRRRSVAGG
jgi:nicotinate-nucleotide adenylyltransferase